MEIKEKGPQAIELINQQGQELQEIVAEAKAGGDIRVADENLKRWKSRTIRLLSEQVNPDEAEELKNKSLTILRMGDQVGNLEREADIYFAFLKSLLEQLEKHPEDVLPLLADIPTVPIQAPQPTVSRTVFIVHGHDESNKLTLEKLIQERWGLEPLVLSYEPGKGRTLIEKFEQEAQRAAYALVLITPDDLIKVADDEYAQARPNAIFELGWFYGRLGRQKVCILLRKDTKIHTDLDGITRIEFSESVEEKVVELEKELREAGLL